MTELPEIEPTTFALVEFDDLSGVVVDFVTVTRKGNQAVVNAIIEAGYDPLRFVWREVK